MKPIMLLRSAVIGVVAFLSAGCVDGGYDRGYYDGYRRVYRDDYDRGYRRADYYNVRRPFYRGDGRPSSYNRSRDFLMRNNGYRANALDRGRGYRGDAGRGGFRPRIRPGRSF